MKIQHIQDYSQRIQNQKPIQHSIPSGKEFWDILKQDNSLLQKNKISSSEISIPENIRKEIQENPYKKKLFDASVEFEAIFVKLMLKEMKKSIQRSHWIHGGYAEEIFQDMLTDEQAKQISLHDSIGLAEKIYSSLSKSIPDSSRIP